MPDISVAPHAQPGDTFSIVPRHGDFPPDKHPDPVAKGKVASDVTVPVPDKLEHGDYWILVGGKTIGFQAGTDEERRGERERKRAQKEADALAERNRQEKERLVSKDEPDTDQPQENRPPNPEDQPNELPIGDNTGTTRNPTGNDRDQGTDTRRSRRKGK